MCAELIVSLNKLIFSVFSFVFKEHSIPTSSSSSVDKAFDTNTFVMKKKERRKISTMTSDNNFNGVCLQSFKKFFGKIKKKLKI